MLEPEDLQRIFYWRYGKYREEWQATNKPLVQQALRRACWQCVLDAVREESAERLERLELEAKKRQREAEELERENERLELENAELKQVILRAIEADANRHEHHRPDAAGG